MKKTIKFILITLIIAGIAFAGYKIYHSYAGVEKITVFKTVAARVLLTTIQSSMARFAQLI